MVLLKKGFESTLTPNDPCNWPHLMDKTWLFWFCKVQYKLWQVKHFVWIFVETGCCTNSPVHYILDWDRQNHHMTSMRNNQASNMKCDSYNYNAKVYHLILQSIISWQVNNNTMYWNYKISNWSNQMIFGMINATNTWLQIDPENLEKNRSAIFLLPVVEHF